MDMDRRVADLKKPAFWKVGKPLQIMDDLVKMFFLECQLLLYRLHQLPVTFNMTNWFSPLAIVTSTCGSDPRNDEQVIIID